MQFMNIILNRAIYCLEHSASTSSQRLRQFCSLKDYGTSNFKFQKISNARCNASSANNKLKPETLFVIVYKNGACFLDTTYLHMGQPSSDQSVHGMTTKICTDQKYYEMFLRCQGVSNSTFDNNSDSCPL